MATYCAANSPRLPVRNVRGATRRTEYQTDEGTRIVPADNSPAWAVHALLLTGRPASYEEFHIDGMWLTSYPQGSQYKLLFMRPAGSRAALLPHAPSLQSLLRPRREAAPYEGNAE